MHLEINDNTRLGEIQKIFSDHYAWLSLAFYRDRHKKYEASDEALRLSPDKTVGEVRNTHVSTLIEIQPSYHVADVEREFMLMAGLSVQVLKKENERWEQTTGLDNLSLHDLNILGRNAADEYIVTDESADEEAIP
jgi:hypothetical protein